MILNENVQQISNAELSEINENQSRVNWMKCIANDSKNNLIFILQNSEGRKMLKSWLNRNFRIEMIDGRRLVGLFLCTDRDANIIIGMCSEYRRNSENEARSLGLVIIKKTAIKKIEVDILNLGEIV